MAEIAKTYVPPIAPQQVLEDAKQPGPLREPAAVLQAERDYIAGRRKSASVPRHDPQAMTAIAISGGGIRSATFSLGLLQALAKANLLRQFDYLSTVSGGGYTGSSLAWWLSGAAGNKPPFGLDAKTFPYGVDAPHGSAAPQDSPEQQQALRYLRQRGEYITPGGGLTLVSGIAAVMRGIFLNVGLLLLFLVSGMVVLHWASFYTLGSAEVVWRLYFEVTDFLGGLFSGGLGTSCPESVAVTPVCARPPPPVLYPFLLGFAALCAAGFGACAILYAFYNTLFPNREKNYRIRRNLDRWAGALLLAFVVSLVLGTLPYIYDNAGQIAAVLIPAAGGLVGAVAAVTKYMKSMKVPGAGSMDGFAVAGSVLLLYALVWSAYGLAQRYFPVTHPSRANAAVLLGMLAVGCYLAVRFNINQITLHRFYRDRLMEAFLPDWNTVVAGKSRAVDFADTTFLPDLAQPGQQAGTPYHLINCNVVLVDSDDLTRAERGGDSFVLAPLHCGSAATGWRPSREFGGGELSLATAMATSGAAANPDAVGVTRNWMVALLMSILNLRLGIWVPHPRLAKQRARPNHVVPGLSQVIQRWGWGYQESAKFLHLSDGGHFENLALYELIRRKTRLIVLSDGAADPKYRFGDFTQLCRRIAIDFGAAIEIISDGGLKRVQPDPDLPFPWPKKRFRAAAGYLEAEIRYAGGAPGRLIYVKAALIEGLPPEVLGYAKANREFPNQTTADQWFDEEQFEAYRQLGHHLGTRMIAEAKLAERLAAL